jgi:hypothetical protein
MQQTLLPLPPTTLTVPSLWSLRHPKAPFHHWLQFLASVLLAGRWNDAVIMEGTEPYQNNCHLIFLSH